MNNEPVSTLMGFSGELPGRRVGNTTRLVDHSIQLLFTWRVIACHDQYNDGRHREANKRLFDLIIKRLREHPGLDVGFDKTRLIIQIPETIRSQKAELIGGKILTAADLEEMNRQEIASRK